MCRARRRGSSSSPRPEIPRPRSKPSTEARRRSRTNKFQASTNHRARISSPVSSRLSSNARNARNSFLGKQGNCSPGVTTGHGAGGAKSVAPDVGRSGGSVGTAARRLAACTRLSTAQTGNDGLGGYVDLAESEQAAYTGVHSSSQNRWTLTLSKPRQSSYRRGHQLKQRKVPEVMRRPGIGLISSVKEKVAKLITNRWTIAAVERQHEGKAARLESEQQSRQSSWIGSEHAAAAAYQISSGCTSKREGTNKAVAEIRPPRFALQFAGYRCFG